jgi:hypothetical protein
MARSLASKRMDRGGASGVDEPEAAAGTRMGAWAASGKKTPQSSTGSSEKTTEGDSWSGG